LLAEAEKEILPNVLVKTLVREKEIISKNFSDSIQSSERKSILSLEAEIDLQELNGIDMGGEFCIPQMPTQALSIISAPK
jgi:hypothetical protein